MFTINDQTAVLISVWMHCPYIDARGIDVGDLDKVDSRGALAIARTNWLHNKYPQIVRYFSSLQIDSKKLIRVKRNDDLLYTMCLFVLEPTVSSTGIILGMADELRR